MTQYQMLSVEIEAGAEPPREFRIFAAGVVDTVKGQFLFDAQAAESVLKAAADWGNRYSADYEHNALDAALAGPKPAAAWYDLELRGGELWAVNVQWTPRAAEMLRAREYRYLSPAFDFDRKTGRIVSLTNIALTNLPATRDMTPLVASKDTMNPNDEQKKLADAPAPADEIPEEPAADPMAECADTIKACIAACDECLKECAAITVDASADDSVKAAAQSVIDACNAHKEALAAALPAFEPAAPATDPAADAPMASSLMALTGTKSLVAALGVVAAGKAALDELAALRAKDAERVKLSQATERKELIAKLSSEKRLTPAQKTWAESVALDALRSFAGVAPVITQLSASVSTEPGKGSGKKWEDFAPIELAKLHASNPDLYAALKADRDQRASR